MEAIDEKMLQDGFFFYFTEWDFCRVPSRIEMFQFWNDVWCGPPLKEEFPSIFWLALRKDGSKVKHLSRGEIGPN